MSGFLAVRRILFRNASNGTETRFYLHAEIDAIRKAIRRIGKDRLRDCSMYVARWKRTQTQEDVQGLAKPCKGCSKALEVYGIADVYWTENTA